MSSARSAGKKILIATSGTRGDVQPFVALGKGLLKAGFAVRCWTNINHCAFFEQEGLDAASVNHDVDKLIREDPTLRKAMALGDVPTFFKALEEVSKREFPGSLREKIADLQSWQPDLIISGALDITESTILASVNGIPCILANLSVAFYPSRWQPTVAKEPSWGPHLLMGTVVGYSFYMSIMRGKAEELLRQLPEGGPYLATSFREHMFLFMHPVAPVLAGVSPTLARIQDDWSQDSKRQVKLTGVWVLSKEEQHERFARADALFGGHDREALEAFLQGGGPPIYMGWGSMLAVSPEHMTCLAVRSLKEAGLRGIVLKGWAQLGMDKLAGQPDSEALAEYAKRSVLFVGTAPHEWLFPKCAALVHHGGAGTFAAAVRSGVPSIITPCFLDQFDHARIVSEQGIGVGLPQFSSVKVRQLVKALKTCTGDSTVIHKSRAMAEKMMSEDGIGEAIHVVDDFLADEVATGKWRSAHDRQVAKLQKFKSQGPPGCFSWFARMCCSAEPNKYDVV